jgi:hypothetical protein
MVKTITVRVVEHASTDGNTGTTVLSQQSVDITEQGGFDAAVKEAFPTFPNNCQRVVLQRGGVFLWSKGVDNNKWQYSPAEAYALVQEGDVVVIHKRVYVVGPDPLVKGNVPDGPGGVNDYPLPASGQPPGPTTARADRMRALLTELELL